MQTWQLRCVHFQSYRYLLIPSLMTSQNTKWYDMIIVWIPTNYSKRLDIGTLVWNPIFWCWRHILCDTQTFHSQYCRANGSVSARYLRSCCWVIKPDQLPQERERVWLSVSHWPGWSGTFDPHPAKRVMTRAFTYASLCVLVCVCPCACVYCIGVDKATA